MSKHKLGFDSTDADTLAASDYVGSHLYAGGVLLTQTQVGAKEALDVYVANDIMVDLDGFYDVGTNPTPDSVGFIGHSRAASPDETNQVERITVGAASSDNVVAANVHGMDVNSFGMVYDGTTWDRLQGTGGAVHIHDGGNTITVDGTVELGATTLAALETITVVATDLDIRDLAFATDKVDVSGSEVSLDSATLAALETITVLQGTDPWVIGDGGGSITVDGSVTVNDAAIANTAIESTAATVGTSAAALLASQLANRKYWMGYNNSNKMVYIGKASVTTANGMPQAPGVYMEYRLGPALSMQAIGDGAGLDYRLMELS